MPCLWQDGSAEQGEGGKSGIGRRGGVDGGVDPHMFPARKKEVRSCNSFALFTNSSDKLKNRQ